MATQYSLPSNPEEYTAFLLSPDYGQCIFDLVCLAENKTSYTVYIQTFHFRDTVHRDSVRPIVIEWIRANITWLLEYGILRIEYINHFRVSLTSDPRLFKYGAVEPEIFDVTDATFWSTCWRWYKADQQKNSIATP